MIDQITPLIFRYGSLNVIEDKITHNHKLYQHNMRDVKKRGDGQ